MNLSQLIEVVNDLSDEYHESKIVTASLNDAIAKINVEVGANFPYLNLTDSNTEYAGFPEKWQRTLLVPFAVGRSKQKEGSQFEYTDAYTEFVNNVTLFKSKYPIPDEYRDTTETSVIVHDYSNDYYKW